MAVRDDVEAGGFRQAQRNPRGSIADFDVFLRQKRKPHIHVATAIVNFDFAAGVFQRDVVLCAKVQVAGGVKNLQVAGTGLHVSGKLREREVGAPRDKPYSLCDFVRANRPVEFAVDGQSARRTRYVDFPAVPCDLDVAFRVGNLDVALPRINADVSAGAANLDVTHAICHTDGLRHVRHRDVTLLVSNRQRSLLRNRHVQIEADSRVAYALPCRPDFIAVAILDNFDANAIGKLLGIALIPGLGIFLTGSSNLRVVRWAHADVSSTVSNRDAGIRGNGLGRDVQFELKTVSPLPDMAWKIFSSEVHSDNDAKQAKQSQNKEDFARGNRRSSLIA